MNRFFLQHLFNLLYCNELLFLSQYRFGFWLGTGLALLATGLALQGSSCKSPFRAGFASDAQRFASSYRKASSPTCIKKQAVHSEQPVFLRDLRGSNPWPPPWQSVIPYTAKSLFFLIFSICIKELHNFVKLKILVRPITFYGYLCPKNGGSGTSSGTYFGNN